MLLLKTHSILLISLFVVGVLSAGGEPESETKPEGESENPSEPESETKPEGESGNPTEPESETDPEGESENPTEPESETKPEGESENPTEPESETDPEGESENPTEPESETDPKGESENPTEPESETNPEGESENPTEPESETDPEGESENPTEPESETDPEGESENPTEPESETKPDGESETPAEPEGEDQNKPIGLPDNLPEPENDEWWFDPGNTGTWWRTVKKTTSPVHVPTKSSTSSTSPRYPYNGKLKDDKEKLNATLNVVLVAMGVVCSIIILVLVILACKSSRSKTFELEKGNPDEKWPEVVTHTKSPSPSYKSVLEPPPAYTPF